MTQSKHIEAWAAGFFKGEGSICLHRRVLKSGRIRHLVRCDITNTELLVLDHLQNHFGGYIYPRKGTALSKKPLWVWCMTDKTSEEFLKRVYPFMIGRKKYIAEGAMALRAKMKAKRTGKGQMASLNGEEIAARDAIMTNIQQYISKGKRK